MGPVLRRIYDQMCEPKWVMAFGVCASTGGFYQNYSTMPGCDQVIPVDVYIPGCPPRPEQVLDGLIMLQERIQRGEGHSQIYLAAEKGYDVPLAAIRPIAERPAQDGRRDQYGAGEERGQNTPGVADRAHSLLKIGSSADLAPTLLQSHLGIVAGWGGNGGRTRPGAAGLPVVPQGGRGAETADNLAVYAQTVQRDGLRLVHRSCNSVLGSRGGGFRISRPHCGSSRALKRRTSAVFLCDKTTFR